MTNIDAIADQTTTYDAALELAKNILLKNIVDHPTCYDSTHYYGTMFLLWRAHSEIVDSYDGDHPTDLQGILIAIETMWAKLTLNVHS